VKVLVAVVALAATVLGMAGGSALLLERRLSTLAPGGVTAGGLHYNVFTGRLALSDVRARDAEGREVFRAEQVLATGIDCAWNDNNEYELWNEDAVCDGFGRPVALDLARPIQALLMTRASFEEQARAKPGERPFTVTRAGCPGIRNPGLG